MYIKLLNNPWMILAIPPVLILLAMILRKPVIGVYISAFFIPFEDLTTLFTDVTLLKIVLAYTFLAWLLKTLTTKNQIRFEQMSYIILLTIWSGISLAWSYSLNDSINRILTFIQLILFAIMAFNLLETRAHVEAVMIVYIIASMLTAVMAIDLLSSGVLLRNRAAFIEGQNPNGFSRSLGMALLFILYFLQTNRFKYKPLLYFVGVLLLLTIVFAQSRGTYAALIISIIPIVYFSKIGFKLRIALMGVITTSLAFYLFPDVLLEYVFPRTNLAFTELSLGGREIIWRIGWEMIKYHPFFGVGFGNFTSIYGLYSMPLRGWYAETDPHNVFVAFQAELGIIGTFIFTSFLYQIFRKIKSINSVYLTEKTWALALFLYIVVAAMTNSLHYAKFFWFALALLVAFINQNDFFRIDSCPENDRLLNRAKLKAFYASE